MAKSPRSVEQSLSDLQRLIRRKLSDDLTQAVMSENIPEDLQTADAKKLSLFGRLCCFRG